MKKAQRFFSATPYFRIQQHTKCQLPKDLQFQNLQGKRSKCDYFLNVSTIPLTEKKKNSIYCKDFEAMKNEDITRYHQSIKSYRATPLYKLDGLAKKYGVGEIWLKDESQRFDIKTFKALGASYAVHKCLERYGQDSNRQRTGEANNGKRGITFCSATDGNHGRSVAWAARMNNCNAVIYVPYFTSKARIQNIASEGATVKVVDAHYDETVQQAMQEAQKNEWIFVQDNSWPGYTDVPALIMAGYRTIMKEIEAQLPRDNPPEFDYVMIQSGVGTWTGSAVWHYCHDAMLKNKTRPVLINVEPYESDCIMESAKQGKITQCQKSMKTIMAGLNCGTPSMISFPLIRDNMDLFISVSDDYAERAMRELAQHEPRIVAGESGAASLAGALALLDGELQHLKNEIGMNENSRLLLFNTEGDTDPESYQNIVQ